MKKTTYLTSDQRAELIEQCLDWYEDWQATDPITYPDTRETLKNEMQILNNSDLIKHINDYYIGGNDSIFNYV